MIISASCGGCGDNTPAQTDPASIPAANYVGSLDISSYGGAAYYPKAQSFIATSNLIEHVAIYMLNGCTTPWRVRILSSLPAGGGGESGLVNQADLESKTLGFAQVDVSSPGWVDFHFVTPINVSIGNEYFIFVGSSDLGTFGPSAVWAASIPGLNPGPYSQGEGWIYVFSWSNNSNYLESYEKHTDYAFKIYQ
jgi:hypothetical protein